MSTGFIVFALAVVVGIVVLFRVCGKKGHYCRYCRRTTSKIADLPKAQRDEVTRIIQNENMGEVELSTFDICTQCRRIYDWRWFDDDRPFRRDWDMYDRQCYCDADLRRPSSENIGSDQLRKALQQIRPDAVEYIRKTYKREDFSRLTYDLTIEDHIFFICPRCKRIYMWLPAENYRVFQCVTEGCKPYDNRPEDDNTSI